MLVPSAEFELACCSAQRDMPQWACFSADRTHRYSLWRRWDWGKPMLVALMLNPSTADEYTLDNTLTRVMGYAKDWGYAGFEILNAFSLKSTDPKALVAGDPNDYDRLRNAHTDAHIRRAIDEAGIVMVGWSTHLSKKRLQFRLAEIKALIGDHPIYAWKLNADGTPAHPLYLPRDIKPAPYKFS